MKRLLKLLNKRMNIKKRMKTLLDGPTQMSKQLISTTPPPNILILTSNENDFRLAKQFFTQKQLLGANSYTIYRLDTTEVNRSLVWMKNSAALITFCDLSKKREMREDANSDDDDLDEEATLLMQIFSTYLKLGRSILTIFNDDKFDAFERKYEKMLLNDSEMLMMKQNVTFNENCFYFSFIKSNISSIHLFSKVNIREYDEETSNVYSTLIKDYLKLKLIEDNHNQILPNEEGEEVYHLFTRNELLQAVSVVKSFLTAGLNKKATISNSKYEENAYFDASKYYEKLKTKQMGDILLYSSLVSSTMNSLENLPSNFDSLVVVAMKQNHGQGNNKNEWLSPLGCCMFSLYLNFSSSQFPTDRICLLQFVSALSCVKAVKCLSSAHQELPIQIKWPNDIYYEKKFKLGGVLSKTSIMGLKIGVIIGVGFNLNNQLPTDCLNRIMEENKLPRLAQEEFIASFLNHFEYYFKLLAKFDGINAFINDYEENWIHSNQKVRVNDWNADGEIIGINQYGYLKVKKLNEDEIHCLHPNGNRFDMMHDMIILRM